MKRAVLLVALSGCGGSTMGPAAVVDMASAMTDKQYCDAVCTKLITCGVEYTFASCSTGCQTMAPVFLACIKMTSLDDCNGLALCSFRQGGCIPAGAGTCNQAQACEGACTAQNAPASCACACIQAMAPSHALSLVINNQCALTRCPFECGNPGMGSQCLACYAQQCQTENGQCRAN